MPSSHSQTTKGLRSSCDKCHQSKLKCVPGPNGCQRCRDLDHICVYSPPGRSGRVPASERGAAKDKDKAKKAALRDVITPPRSQSPSDNEFVVPPKPHAGDEINVRRSSSKPDPLAFQGDSVLDSMDMMGDDTLAVEPFDSGAIIMDASTATVPSAGGFDMVDFAMSDAYKSPEAFDHRLSIPTSVFARPLCGCFPSILRALERVQNPSVSEFSLDAILSCSKSALVDICNSLKCIYSHDSSTRLLTLVVIHRVLHLYRLVYQSHLQDKRATQHGAYDSTAPCHISTTPWSSNSGTCHASPASQSSHLTKDYFSSTSSDTLFLPPDSTPNNNASAASKGRLSLGTYQLDHADEKLLTKQILILDLNKIPRLLDRLDRRAYGPDASHGLDLHHMMRSALITEFRSLVTEATAQL